MEDFFIAFLQPVLIVVGLPISILLINKAKYNKKFSFLEKCVENGVEINPDLIIDQGKLSLPPRAMLKTMLLNRLAGGLIFLLIGIGLLFWSVLFHFKDIAILSAIAFIAVGIGLLVWYFIGKKMLAEDMKDEKEALDQQENRSSK